MASNNGRSTSESFKAQALVYRHMFSILDSMCLKWIIDCRIPNIIHDHGKAITLLELVSVLKIPSTKVDRIDVFMRYMAYIGYFDITKVRIHGDNDGSNQEEEKEAFALTAASELLVKGTKNPCISPMVEFVLDPVHSDFFNYLSKWFSDENRRLYEITSGTPWWELLDKNPRLLGLFNDAMAGDSQMIKLALKDHNMAFEGLETIVDVGGGTGTTAQIFSEKFPELKYIVFDLPQVVKNLKACNNLSFVGGDMFESIPKADAILLKSVLHNWSDNNCIKILRNCKDAVKVLSKDKKGKIIILETVINEEQDEPEITRLKFLMNINMQIMHGKERSEEEWKNIFHEAGLYDYKIFSFTGYLSLIEDLVCDEIISAVVPNGFEQDKKVVVIAATNRKEDLDPALISRFDTMIPFGLLDHSSRQQIASKYAKHLIKPELDELARVTKEPWIEGFNEKPAPLPKDVSKIYGQLPALKALNLSNNLMSLHKSKLPPLESICIQQIASKYAKHLIKPELDELARVTEEPWIEGFNEKPAPLPKDVSKIYGQLPALKALNLSNNLMSLHKSKLPPLESICILVLNNASVDWEQVPFYIFPQLISAA
ncbi:hypothetical protein AHAS_Ahas04G0253500 [Arachis hypogaea]